MFSTAQQVRCSAVNDVKCLMSSSTIPPPAGGTDAAESSNLTNIQEAIPHSLCTNASRGDASRGGLVLPYLTLPRHHQVPGLWP